MIDLTTGSPAVPGTGPDPERIALAVQACPLVARLHAGAFGEVATYLPGRRVHGVRVGATRVEIHVVGRYPATMVQIANQIRGAVAGLSGAAAIDVTIEDVAEPGELSTAPVAPRPAANGFDVKESAL